MPKYYAKMLGNVLFFKKLSAVRKNDSAVASVETGFFCRIAFLLINGLESLFLCGRSLLESIH